jgi:hypothetical protein
MTPPESVVICEGYHDRAFLNAWFLALGCTAYKDKIYPPFGKKVTGGGQFVLRSNADRWIRIVPTHGEGKWREVADAELGFRSTRALDRVVVVLDDDGDRGAPASRTTSFEGWAAAKGATRVEATSEFALKDGGVVPTGLSLVVWSAPDAPAVGLPAKQTLERLVCAAIARTHPERTEPVCAWLASRPSPPPDEKHHKSHAASHMAGWFSDRGYEGFFAAIWEDGHGIRSQLERILDETGARAALDRVLVGP